MSFYRGMITYLKEDYLNIKYFPPCNILGFEEWFDNLFLIHDLKFPKINVKGPSKVNLQLLRITSCYHSMVSVILGRTITGQSYYIYQCKFEINSCSSFRCQQNNKRTSKVLFWSNNDLCIWIVN